MRRIVFLAALLILIPATHQVEAATKTRTVTIHIQHSRFLPQTLEFDEGDRVRFVVKNSDPIDHELIIGDEAVQLAHELGTEPLHGAVPGEVTVFAGDSGETTYQFDRPGTLEFACHFPGHYAYGMKGTIRIR